MDSPPPPDAQLQTEVARLRRRLERERAARKEAESIAEVGLNQLYQRERQMLLLAQVTSAANQSTSVREALQQSLSLVCQSMGWNVAHAYTVEPTNQGPRLRSMALWYSDRGATIAEFIKLSERMEFAPGVGLPGTVYSTGVPQWEFDVTCSPNFPRREGALAGDLKAACAFPILLGQEVAAVLEFYTDKAVARDEALLALMAQVGIQLGRVIERSRAEEKLIHDASHDGLTGLPNRARFLDRLDLAFDRRRSRGPEFAVMFIDLDRFKLVNDSLGHHAGDALIRQVAERLAAILRRTDPIVPPARMPERSWATGALARMGGDEFTILLEDVHDASDAVRVAQRVQEALRTPFQIDGRDIYTSASIGIATSANRYECAEEVLRDADLAMYRAKALGKSRTELYDQGMHSAALKRLALESDLRRALLNEEFVLHYQPIVELDGDHIVGFEALVRWQTPDGRLVPPGDFIGVSEETGLIVQLGLWVLREACTTAKRLQAQFPRREPFTMSVNLSPRQFQQPDLVENVRQILVETGVEPRSIRLEITENTAAGDPERVIDILSRLKALGLRLSLDDFGTGYSSLSYLQRFPLDILKIDRSFVSALHENEESLQIVRTVLNLAKSLGMSVVAEGTEMPAQVRQLKDMGCEFGQGFYFAKPMPGEALQALLCSQQDDSAAA